MCGDEVEHGKPAPDCFLQLAQQMGVPPSDCLVIEDSPAGKIYQHLDFKSMFELLLRHVAR